jgi:hypothetical protein
MSDLLSGLTRRISDHTFDQESAEELSFLVEEAAEGCDDGDLLIEMYLGVEDADDVGDLETLLTEAAVVADDAVVDDYCDSCDEDEEFDDVEDEDGEYDESEEDAYDDELDDLDSDSDDAAALNEGYSVLKDYEVI